MPDFAESVGVPKSTFSKISVGALAPAYDRAVVWAERLGLTERDRQKFLDLAAIMHLPVEARPRFLAIIARLSKTELLVDDLESQADNLNSRLDKI